MVTSLQPVIIGYDPINGSALAWGGVVSSVVITVVNSGVGKKASLLRSVSLLLSVLMLQGCTDHSSPEYFLDEYIIRLSRVTAIDIVGPTLIVPKFPPLRVRAYPLPDIRLKALAALDLLKCPALSQTVAYRNSSLGRQMLPSQLYFYEKTLLQNIPECINDLQQRQGNEEIINKLWEVLAQKQAVFPAVEWNLIFANTEISKQLTSQGRLLSADRQSGFQGTREALNYLASMLTDQTLKAPYNLKTLEHHLQQVSASRYLGQLLYSAGMLTQTLKHSTEILARRLKQSPVCPARNPAEAERLYNVFQLFYRDKIQPYLAQVHQQGTMIRQDLQRILIQLPPPPNQQMTDYLRLISDDKNTESPWYQLSQGIRQHARTWQQVFSQCGESVANNGWG